MEDSKVLAALITALGTIISVVIGVLVYRRQKLHDHHAAVNMEAWKERNTEYRKLIKCLEIVPCWPTRINSLTRYDLFKCSESLKEWYYAGGGLFLSTQSMEKYKDVQKILTKISKSPADNEREAQSGLIPMEYNDVHQAMSALRSDLTKDLLSRERNLLTKSKK